MSELWGRRLEIQDDTSLFRALTGLPSLVFILKKMGIGQGFSAGKGCDQICVSERCLCAAMSVGGRRQKEVLGAHLVSWLLQ